MDSDTIVVLISLSEDRRISLSTRLCKLAFFINLTIYFYPQSIKSVLEPHSLWLNFLIFLIQMPPKTFKTTFYHNYIITQQVKSRKKKN